MKTKTKHLLIFILVCTFLSTSIALLAQAGSDAKTAGVKGEVSPKVLPPLADYILLKYEKKKTRTIWAWVSAYSRQETCPDNNPCITASGEYARQDIVACPRRIKLGTQISIDGRDYICGDRLSPRYDERFDVWFGDDYQAALAFGKQWLQVEIITE